MNPLKNDSFNIKNNILLLNQWKIDSTKQTNNINQSYKNFKNSINTSIPKSLKIKSMYRLGSYSDCPVDYIPVSCSCGSRCGSWDIQNDKTCHC